jgi:hypothetical protein
LCLLKTDVVAAVTLLTEETLLALKVEKFPVCLVGTRRTLFIIRAGIA